MTRFNKLLAVAFTFAALALWSTPAQAQCNVPAGFGNLFGTVAECDDSGPVTGTLQGINGAGDIGSPVDDSWICLSSSQQFCSGTQAGMVGDGLIAFTGNWANPNIQGCPYEPQGPTLGRNFYNITDASGNKLLVSVGRDRNSDTFAADNAWPADAAGNIIGNLACTNPRENTTLIANTTSEIPGVGTLAALTLLCNDPVSHDDCQAGTRGQQLSTGSCAPGDPAFLGSIQALNLYTSPPSDCTGNDLNYDIARGGWIPTPGATNLGGGLWSASLFLPTTGCLFVGCSFGNESAATEGSCASDGSACQDASTCPGACSNNDAACQDSSTCTGLCSAAPLPCSTDANCGDFGLGTCEGVGTCDPSTCDFPPPTQTELTQISSALAVTAVNAASPKARGVAGEYSRGRAFVSWTTETEVGVAAYQIERIGRGGRVDVVRQVSPRGQASSYREEFGANEFRKGGGKGNRVRIRTILNGGGEIVSDSASF